MEYRYEKFESTVTLRCNGCKKQYDLVKLKRITERKNERDIKCPHCKIKIGELN